MKKPFALLWIFFGGVLVFSWVYLPTLSKYRDLKLQQDELDKQLEQLTQDVQDTRQERDLLKNDVEYLEKVIRDELGLVKPGEIVYKFVQDAPEAEPSPSAGPVNSPELITPSPSPSPSVEIFPAKPIVPKPKGVAPTVKPKALVLPKKTLPPKKKVLLPTDQEPSYPRRETR